MPAAVVLRRLVEDDWQVLKALRLAALADAPDAFGATLAEEQQYDEEAWRAWPSGAAVFVAEVAQAPAGLAGGVAGTEQRERRLIAMWVDPRFRRHGVGSALGSAVVRWAAEEGADRLSLWVTRTNGPAVELYLRLGFAPAGVERPLPSDPTRLEDLLVRDLAHPAKGA